MERARGGDGQVFSGLVDDIIRDHRAGNTEKSNEWSVMALPVPGRI